MLDQILQTDKIIPLLRDLRLSESEITKEMNILVQEFSSLVVVMLLTAISEERAREFKNRSANEPLEKLIAEYISALSSEERKILLQEAQKESLTRYFTTFAKRRIK